MKTPSTTSTPATDLRRALRQQRHNLTEAERHQQTNQLIEHLISHRLFKKARHIALFLANDGEPDLRPLLVHAHQLGKRIYLPVVSRPYQLSFYPYQPGEPLLNNRYGIAEPEKKPGNRRAINQLDLVLTPLVAFDQLGYRLGMGGGYYDRCFAGKQSRQHWHKPRLIGVAYQLQGVTALSHQPWDVRLDAVVTETGWQSFS